jgi:predicted porin
MFSKKIVAAAALLAVAAGAQAAGVNVYGSLDMSIGSFKPVGTVAGVKTKSATKVESGVMSTGSYIGFAGTEDLGGGLTAGFALESFIAADTGATPAGPFWGRTSHIYLTGGFGKLALGQYDAPVYTTQYSYNPFGDSTIFSPTQAGYGTKAVYSNGTSTLNAVTYETPNLGGFKAIGQYAPKETATGKNSYSLGASYNAGPLSVMLAYGKPGTPTSTVDRKDTILGASYDFGVVKAFAQYAQSKNTAAKGDKYTGYQLGATVPVTASGNVLVSYGEAKPKPTNVKDKMFSIGYDHALSKRSSVYAAANQVKQTRMSSGKNFAVGVKHAF